MNALKYAVAALGTTLAAVVISAPPAHADSRDFISDVHAAGWSNSSQGDAGLLASGRWVCRELSQYLPTIPPSRIIEAVADDIYSDTGPDVDYDEATGFVVLSIQNLCPWAVIGRPA